MELDLRELDPRHAHDLMTSSIIPRPIAWVSTISRDGEINLAPFNFFTGVSWNPPAIVFSPVNRNDGTKKDTVINIEDTKEFVVHIVSTDLLSVMESSAKPIPYGADLSVIQGITMVPSKTIKPCRIQEAKISFECVLDRIITVGDGANAGNLIIGLVQLFHARDDVVSGGRVIDWQKLDALGRLSGSKYCAIQTVMDSETN